MLVARALQLMFIGVNKNNMAKDVIADTLSTYSRVFWFTDDMLDGACISLINLLAMMAKKRSLQWS